MGPANVGSVARSVAAYGLPGFRLAAPRCEIDEETQKWACYGQRVLNSVESFDSLNAALHDVDFAVALSRRDGKNRHRHYSLPVLAEEVLPKFAAQRVAFVFGNEESGLNKDHLAACHCSVEIPTIAEDGSLNLAHAVTTTLYECIGRAKAAPLPAPKNEHEQLAGPERLRDLLQLSGELLARVGYPHHRSSLEDELVKLQTIVLRSRLEEWEVRLLMGMIKQVRYRLENPSEASERA